jgi:hypothetical protein
VLQIGVPNPHALSIYSDQASCFTQAIAKLKHAAMNLAERDILEPTGDCDYKPKISHGQSAPVQNEGFFAAHGS